MNFSHSEDFAALLDALGKLLSRFAGEAADGQRCAFHAGLDAALEESGLLDAGGVAELGVAAAAMLVEETSRRPQIAEIAASALVRPLVCPDWPRPIAVIAGDVGRPARYLQQARSVLFLARGAARIGRMEPGDAAPVGDFFAYPMARLADPGACHSRSVRIGDASDIRRLLHIATACEIAGALQGALDAVVEHVRNRRQFGRALGSFQAIQHRLARAAAEIAAGRLLAMKAAATARAEDALVALGHNQDCALRLAFDLHQFMGAMGLTLEHPLYRWTYRIRLLVSDFGGPAQQFLRLSDEAWADDTPMRAKVDAA